MLESMRVFTSIFMGKNHDNTNSLTSAAAERNQWWWPLKQLFLSAFSQLGIKDIIRSREVTWVTLPTTTLHCLCREVFRCSFPCWELSVQGLWEVCECNLCFPSHRAGKERVVVWILYLKIMNIFVTLCD